MTVLISDPPRQGRTLIIIGDGPAREETAAFLHEHNDYTKYIYCYLNRALIHLDEITHTDLPYDSIFTLAYDTIAPLYHKHPLFHSCMILHSVSSFAAHAPWQHAYLLNGFLREGTSALACYWLHKFYFPTVCSRYHFLNVHLTEPPYIAAQDFWLHSAQHLHQDSTATHGFPATILPKL